MLIALGKVQHQLKAAPVTGRGFSDSISEQDSVLSDAIAEV